MLTLTSNGDRFALLEKYVSSDLLGFRGDCSGDTNAAAAAVREGVLAAMLPSDSSLWRKKGDDDRTAAAAGPVGPTGSTVTPAMAMQSTLVRLVNAVASVKKGRDYLGETLSFKKLTFG